MNRVFSLYLDGLRAGAALVVLLSHFAYPRFTEGRYLWIRDLNLGSDAVVVFFVLSGLVIAFCADQKEKSFGHFAFARTTRLLSVALPALVIGFALDRSGSLMFPDFYANQYFNPVGFWEQLLRGLSFSNEWNMLATRLGTNGPYWSLSYEAAYYALFAVFFFIQGVKRWVLLTVIVLLFGLNIMLLLPCWLVGVWLYNRLKTPAQLSFAWAMTVTIAPILFYGCAQSTDLPHTLTGVTLSLITTEQYYGLRFSNEFIWNFALAILTAVHLIGAYALCQRAAVAESRMTRSVKYTASISFSLYLFHYPVLQFLKPMMLSLGNFPLPDMMLLATTLLVCALFGTVFERTLEVQRALIMPLFLTRIKPV